MKPLKNKYKLGLLDCPWTYDNKQQNDPARGGITYPTLTMKELYDIPIGNAFEDNSLLVVWVTFPKLMDEYYEQYNPLSIIRNWGFRPVTTLFVWVKLNRKANIQTMYMSSTNPSKAWTPTPVESIYIDSLYSGLGRYTNSNAEIAIIARRGKMLPRLDKTVKQLIFAPISIHSAKPREQYERLHRLFGDVPRVELFARSVNPPPDGWQATGLEYDGVDIKDWIKQYA